MIYAIPSIPVPHVLDQLGFAMQLSAANVATKPLKSKELSEETIVARIEEMNAAYAEKKKNAEMLSQKIRSENGVANAVRLIEAAMQN